MFNFDFVEFPNSWGDYWRAVAEESGSCHNLEGSCWEVACYWHSVKIQQPKRHSAFFWSGNLFKVMTSVFKLLLLFKVHLPEVPITLLYAIDNFISKNW